ncbi:MAG: exopolyphosphatase / guanosine-5-triphosphate,3-diphosphate pyrophosphatase [Alphaproteobacteria bacterium]|jgi:exopolyphosphatase/guanosine-5'-triphosphate,3'-diphosphate pyrophosphatase|nr:exopolyphosphatase / guanosine-5-triphosphate,3-diphosphate pyrophosphatase [Alphaproteobacteria bacterium]
MDDEARATGLGPVPDREPKGQSPGSRRGRRSPYRHPRQDRSDGGGGQGGLDISGPTYAALDLGTNNCRLLVARATRDSFRVVDAFSRIIRLGEGITSSGRLSEPAILRAVDALRVCRAKMRNRGVTRSRLIATEACRSAGNGLDFLERIRNEVGIELEIVDRETEALLAATGCTPLVDPAAEGVILFDIGGGSSELVRLSRCSPTEHGPPHPEIEAWVSIPIGVVTLAERHGGVTVSRESFEAMIAEVAIHVDRFAAEHGGIDGLHMLGTSGTVTTIAGVYLDLPRYERRRVDGCWLNGAQVTDVVERLLAMSYEGRVANPCIGAERADLVLAGCAILEAIRRAFPCERLRVADRGLREGMLVQMMREDGVWGDAGASAP